MKTYELQPLKRKSFYWKCKIIDDWKFAKLQSYNTIVAEYNHETNKINVFGWYSSTTARHINAFLSHFWFDTATKKEMENWK